MVRARSIRSAVALCAVALLCGCDSGGADQDTGSATDVPTSDGPEPDALDGAPDAAPDRLPDVEPRPVDLTRFVVTVDNRSQTSSLPSAIAPGVFALQRRAGLLFTAGEPDRGAGLEALAEDGRPEALAAALAKDPWAIESGVFAASAGGSASPGIFPGESYQFEVTAAPGEGTLTFAMMLSETNDRFIAPGGVGIELFDAEGVAVPERDVTSLLGLWDAGTEIDQCPGVGPWQAPRQVPNHTGPREGVVHAFGDSTRAIPTPVQLAAVRVQAVSGSATAAFRIFVDNTSRSRSAMTTPLSPVFWALHDESWSLFGAGAAASVGLEALAEDGSPDALVDEAQSAPGVLVAGAAVFPVGKPDPGAIPPDGSYEFVVTPNAAHGRLSLAFQVVESNDTFVATAETGVALFDASGAPRGTGEVEAELAQQLRVWDAGTEQNEAPGAGPNQPLRQAAPGEGPADPVAQGVTPAADPSNDLQAGLEGLLEVTVVAASPPGRFEVSVRNVSGDAPFALTLPSLLWTLSPGDRPLFEVGAPASPELQSLAEDGRTAKWSKALTADGRTFGVVEIPEGQPTPSGLSPGQRYVATVTATASAPWLNLVGMIQPSNDAFFALGPLGVRLLDEAGQPRSNAQIAKDIRLALAAFDAGTEANQAGAAGPDMAPHQLGANTGSSEGNGLIRIASDPVWQYPPVRDLVRVTIRVVPAAR